jgi:hypothetical protein
MLNENVHMTMTLLLIADNWKKPDYGGLWWHNVHINFHDDEYFFFFFSKIQRGDTHTVKDNIDLKVCLDEQRKLINFG